VPVSNCPPMFSCRRNRAEAARRAVYWCSDGLIDILPSLDRRSPLKRKGRGFLRGPFRRPFRRVPAADSLLRRSLGRRSGRIRPLEC
jgi:hypothetical protein